MSHDHNHDHTEPPSEIALRVKALESLLTEKGLVDPAALDELTQAHPDLRKHLFTPEGKLRAFVNVYLNDEDVRYLPAKEATAVKAGDTLSIIPSIAGGTSTSSHRRDRHDQAYFNQSGILLWQL